MNALDFNSIDNAMEKNVVLNRLSFPEKTTLLESQIHEIYKQWNNSNLKIIETLSSYYNTDIIARIINYDNLLSQARWINKKIDFPNISTNKVFQWDIFYCELGYNIGSEQNKRRPVIILNDTSFIYSTVVLVAPITGNGKKMYRHEVKLLETAYNKVTGKIDLSHIRSVSKTRLDQCPSDRLLNNIEFQNKYKDTTNKVTMLQETILNKLKTIFGIVIH